MFKVGDKVICTRTELCKIGVIEEHTVSKISTKDYCWCDNAHKQEDCWLAAFLYPDTPECREFLQKGIDMAERHKKEENEYMTETYQFNNKLVRAGLK